MPNRTICQVLDELREAYKTRNFSYVDGLTEELQYLANRMEASLYDAQDYSRIKEKLSKAKQDLNKVKQDLLKRGKKVNKYNEY